MPNPAREAWRRLPWRRWCARGTLFGLCSANALALAAFIVQRDDAVRRYPGLADSWWLFVLLGAANLIALLAILSRLPRAVPVLIAINVAALLFELWALGVGPHLLRIPLSLSLALIAERMLRPAGAA
jgi:hypothetical protein